jgi:dihydropyrimidinase
MIDDRQMVGLMQEVKKHGGLINVHATNGDMIDFLIAKHKSEGKLSPLYHYLSQPEVTEAEASSRFADLADYTGCPGYIVHLTCEGALNAVRFATRRNQHVFVETCIQYLILDASLYEQNFEGAKWVMSPPLRKERPGNPLGRTQPRAGEWSPQTIARLCGNKNSWARTISLKFQTAIPQLKTAWNCSLAKASTKGASHSINMLKLPVLTPRKSSGCFKKRNDCHRSDADILILDPNEKHTLSAKTHHMNVDYSGYEGLELTGKVKTVLLRGKVVIDNNECKVSKGYGKFIKRNKVDGKI